jgi:hypothetical protein
LLRSIARRLFRRLVLGTAARRRGSALRRARPSFELLETRLVPTFTNHHGPLLASVQAETLFYGSAWNDGGPNFALTGTFNNFTQYVVNSPYLDMLTSAGYLVGRGSSIAGPIVPANLSSGIVHDSDIQNLIQQSITGGTLVNPNSNTLYVLYVQPGVEIIAANGTNSARNFYAYHADFLGQDASGHALDLQYAVIPYPGSPNLSIPNLSSNLDRITKSTSHEIAEAATDPDLTTNQKAWFDDTYNEEIGDIEPSHSHWTRLDGWIVQDLSSIYDGSLDPVLPGWSLSAGGVLSYSGTNAITITTNSEFGGVTILEGSDRIDYGPDDVTSIQILTGSTATTVNVAATLAAVPVSITGTGSNTINLGAGGSLQALLGPVTIDNPSGASAVTLDDSSDPGTRLVNLTSGSITGLAPAAINFATTYPVFSSLALKVGTGTVNLNAGLTLGTAGVPGNLTLSAGAINISAPVSVTNGSITLTNSGPLTIAAGLSASGAVTQNGSGTITLGAAVSSGGNQSYSGAVSFAQPNLTLTGSTVLFANPVNLGTSTVSITGNLALQASASLQSMLAGTSPSQYGHFTHTGWVSLGTAGLNVSLQSGYMPPASPYTHFDLVQAAGAGSSLTGSFAGLPEGTAVNVGGLNLYMTYLGGTGHDATLQFTNPLHLVLGAPTTVTAGSAFLLTLQAEDVTNNPVSTFGGTVNFTTFDPRGVVPSSALLANGFGLFLATLKTVAGGPCTISATSGTLSTTSAPITVTAGPATNLAFAAKPVGTPTGVTLPAVTVQILDASGNVVTTDNSDVVTVSVASGPGPFLAGSGTTMTAINGVATFSNLTAVVPGSYVLSAAVAGKLTGPYSQAFVVGPLQVVPGSFVGSSSGFSLQFNAPYLVGKTTPVLYGAGSGTSSGPGPSVLVTTDPGHPSNTAAYVEGSLVLSPATNSITFVATNTAYETNRGAPQLPDGDYTVIVRASAAGNGFRALNAGGGFLDGKGTGAPGSGDFTATFTVSVSALGQAVLWAPATADGPGEPLVAPGNNQIGGGYPIYLDSSGGVTSVQVTINYDPPLLSVTGVSGAGFALLPASTPGHAVVQYSGPALQAGSQTPIGFLLATVPGGTALQPMPYGALDLLHLSAGSLNGGAVPVTTSDALHLEAYVADADGSGSYSNADGVLITRAALGADSGFAAYALVDPLIVADTDGSGFIPADAALQANEAGVLYPTGNLPSPAIPGGVYFTAGSGSITLALSVAPTFQVTAALPVNRPASVSAATSGTSATGSVLTSAAARPSAPRQTVAVNVQSIFHGVRRRPGWEWEYP